MAKTRTGVIGLLPRFMQPAMLHCAYAVRLGNWSPFGLLKPSLHEEKWPLDVWLGDAEQGKWIANRRFMLAGCDISFSRRVAWYSKEGSLQWLRSLHGFGWMRDVLAYNDNKAGAKLLRDYVEEWLDAQKQLHGVALEPDVIGERLANWIFHGRFLQQGGSVAFRRRFTQACVRQALQLHKELRKEDGVYGLPAIKGALFVALTLPQCGFLFRAAMRALHKVLVRIEKFIELPQGRNPLYLHHTLRDLLDMQISLYRLGGKQDARLEHAIVRLMFAVQFLRHKDGRMAVFHGGIEGNKDQIAQTMDYLEQIMAGRNMETPPSTVMMDRTGFARLQAGESSVIIDAAPPDYTHPNAFYGTQSFELVRQHQRLVVNCGAFVGNDPAWSRVVKTTAAHSAVCVDDRNSCQFQAGMIPAAMEKVEEVGKEPKVKRRMVDRDGYHFYEGIYNGYAPYAGLMHSRQLLLNEDGTRLSGADHLAPVKGFGKVIRSHDVNLRFHLHPDLKVRRLMNGMVVMQSSHEEWTFNCSFGEAVELNEGIYLGRDGKPESTSQIVIYVPYSPGEEWTVEWSFIRN